MDNNDIESIGVGFDTSGLEKGEAALGRVEDAAKSTTVAVDKLVDAIDKQAATTAAAAAKVTQSQADVNAAFRQTALAGKALSNTHLEISDAAQKLMDRYDPMGTKLRKLTSDMALFRREMGDSVSPAVMKTFQGLEAEIEKVSGLMVQAGVAGGTSAEGFTKSAAAADKSAFATAGARRELVVLGHEVISGNFSRMPGTFMALAARTDILGAIMSPLGAAIAGVAIAAGVLGTAFYKGSQEAAHFNNELMMTGGYAGQTAGSFDEMAKRVAAFTGDGIGKAREALKALNDTGRVSGGVMEQFGDIIVRVHDITGEKLDQLAKDYAKMSDGVTKWAEDHNKAMHFMNTAQYEHIRLLEEQGNKQQAMIEVGALLETSLTTQREKLGYLGQAWHGLAVFASEAWDKMLGIGRPETVEDRLAVATAAVNAARNPLTGRAALGQGRQPDLEASLEAQGIAQSDKLEARRQASHTAQMKRIDEEGIAASKWLDDYLKQHDKLAGKQAEYQKASKAFAAAEAAGTPVSAETQAKILADIDKQFEEHTKHISTQKTEYQLLTTSLQKQLDVANKELETGVKQTAVDKERDSIMTVMEGWKVKATASQKAVIDGMLTELKTTETLNLQRDQSNKMLEENNKHRQTELDATEKSTLKLQDEIRVQQDHNAAIGMSKEALADLTAQRELDKASTLEAMAIRKLDKNLDYESYDATMKLVSAMRQLADLKHQGGVMQQQADSFKTVWNSIDKTAEGVWNSIEQGGSNAFRKLTDTLKTTLWDMLYQMTVRKWMIQIYAQVTGQNPATLMGNGQGGALGGNSPLGLGMNAMSSNPYGMTSVLGNAGTVGAEFLGGTMSGANALGTLGANAAGTGLDGLIASTGGWGTAAAGATAADLGGGAVAAGSLGAEAGAGLAAEGAAGAAGTAGLMGGMSAAVAAIPVVGWVIAAAAVLYSIFGQKGGGPKQDGTFGNLTSGIGLGTHSAQNDQVAQSAAEGLQKQYDTIIKAYGGQVGSTQFGLGFSMDPKGTAPTFLDVTGSKNGQSAFSEVNLNVGRSQQELTDAIASMGSKAILKGLQQSGLDEGIGDYLKKLGDIDALTDGQVSAAIAKVQKASTERATLEEQIFQLTSTATEKLDRTRQQEMDALDDTNKALLERVRNLQAESAASDALAVAIDKANQSASAYQSFLAGINSNIRQYLDKLNVEAGGTASPINQLTASKTQFDQQIALAKTGDRTALSNITSYADQLIKAQTSYTASGSDTGQTIQDVKTALAALPQMETTEEYLARIVKETGGKQVDATAAIGDKIWNGLWGSAGLLSTKFDVADKDINGLLDFNELKAAIGPLASDATLHALIAGADTNGDGQLSHLEIINASLWGTSAQQIAAAQAQTNQVIAAAQQSSAKPPVVVIAPSGWSIGNSGWHFGGGDTSGDPGVNGSAAADASGASTSGIGEGVGVGGAGDAGFAIGVNRVPRDMRARIHKDEAIIPAPFNPWAGGKGLAPDMKPLTDQVVVLTEQVKTLTTAVTGGLNRLTDVTAAGARGTIESIGEVADNTATSARFVALQSSQATV